MCSMVAELVSGCHCSVTLGQQTSIHQDTHCGILVKLMMKSYSSSCAALSAGVSAALHAKHLRLEPSHTSMRACPSLHSHVFSPTCMTPV